MRRIGFVLHPAYLQHDTGIYHPESASRLMAIEARLKKSGVYEQLVAVQLPAEPRSEIERWITAVHDPGLIRRIRTSLPASGLAHVDADTVLSRGSYRAALFAVEGVLAAADRVMAGELEGGFCAVRPPGHHAESNRAMGFCLFNNVAVAARYLQNRYRLGRVAIIDWDVHHGNGTQEIFYEDPTVFYFSVHQYPLYPGTGREDETGRGPGQGFTLNCPLPPGRGDADYSAVFLKRLVPALESFRPDFILVSAGFDAHRADPLAQMNVTEQGFAEMTRVVCDAAGSLCQGRLVSCLEGGYNLEALARSVEQHLIVLSEA